MANGFYARALKEFGDGNIDMVNDTIKAFLIDTGNYTVNLSTHDFLDDVGATAREGSAVTLSGKSMSSGGIFDASDATFSSVTGDTVEAVIIYKDSGVESTSPLICYIDSGTGFPFTPNGSDVVVSWSNATNKIFKLG